MLHFGQDAGADREWIVLVWLRCESWFWSDDDRTQGREEVSEEFEDWIGFEGVVLTPWCAMTEEVKCSLQSTAGPRDRRVDVKVRSWLNKRMSTTQCT